MNVEGAQIHIRTVYRWQFPHFSYYLLIGRTYWGKDIQMSPTGFKFQELFPATSKRLDNPHSQSVTRVGLLTLLTMCQDQEVKWGTGSWVIRALWSLIPEINSTMLYAYVFGAQLGILLVVHVFYLWAEGIMKPQTRSHNTINFIKEKNTLF